MLVADKTAPFLCYARKQLVIHALFIPFNIESVTRLHDRKLVKTVIENI